MTPERHQQLGELYHEALEREPEARAAFLEEACSRSDLMTRQSERLLEMEPDFYGSYHLSGASSLFNEKYEDFITSYKKAIALGGGPAVIASLGHVYGASGKRKEALQMLEELNEIASKRYVPSYYIAWVCSGLGELDETFKWLDKAVQERNGSLVTLKRDVLLEGLQPDPRFQILLRKVGLPE